MNINQYVNPTAIQKHLGGLNYPANKDDLLKHARSQNAPQDIITMLNKLPDKQYRSPVDIEKEIGDLE